MDRSIKGNLDHMKQWMEEKTEGCALNPEKDVENNVKNLIAVKDHVDEVLLKNDKTILELD